MPLRLRRPVAAGAAALVAAALGAVALLRHPWSFAAAEGPRLALVAEAGRSPRRTLLVAATEPLERRLLSLPGVQRVESWTADGRVVLEIQGEPGLDPDTFQLAAERRTDGLALPLDGLTLAFVPPREPLLEIAVRGGAGSRGGRFAREVVVPELARCRGAGPIEVLGFHPLRLAVTPLGSALAAHGLTALDLSARLRILGAIFPAGRVRDGAAVHPLAVRDTVSSLAQLGAVTIPGPRGETPLSEVATFGPRAAADGGWFRYRGEDAVVVRLFATPGSETSSLLAAARDALTRLRGTARGAGLRLSLLPGEAGRASNLRVRFALLGASPRERLRARLAALESGLLAPLADLHPTLIASLYRPEPLLPGEVSPGAEFRPGWDELPGRLEIAFRNAAGARAARARLAAGALRIVDLAFQIEGIERISLELSAPTQESVSALAQRAEHALRERLGTSRVSANLGTAGPALHLAWDDTLLLTLGADPAGLEEQLRASLGGFTAGQVEIDGLEPEIWIEATRVPELDLIPLRTQGGSETAPLRAFARLTRSADEPPFLRVDGRPTIRIPLPSGTRLDSPALAPLLAAIALGPGERVAVVHSLGGGA